MLRHLRTRIPWWPVLAAAALIVVTEAPFEVGRRSAPPGTEFDGLTGMVADQNMYFSFIRQSAEGSWLFQNRLTHLDHRPAMFNLGWLTVGRLTSVVGERWAYFLWRAAGAGLLAGGFWFLLGGCDRTPRQRRIAFVAGLIGGGFGWLFQLLDRAGLARGVPLGQLDVSDGLCFPFPQMLLNPHVSVSHGLTLFGLGALFRGERHDSARWTALGATLFALNGFVRPYDLIVLCAATPAFVLVEAFARRSWSWRTFARRALPLIVAAPVVAYHAGLFLYHPVFRHWSSQGVVTPLGLPWHAVNLGLAGVVALARGLLRKRFPLDQPVERWLAAWIAVSLLLFHAHRLPFFGFMPYTPMLGSALGTTLVAFASAIFPTSDRATHGAADRETPAVPSRVAWQSTLLWGLVLINSLSSAVWVVKIVRNLVRLPEHYVARSELDAYVWLARTARPRDVVLSTLPTGNRMARHVSARFVLGHVNVTPNVGAISARVDRFFRGEKSPAETEAMMDEYGAQWIVARADELDPTRPLTLPSGWSRAFANDQVTIWSRAADDDDQPQ